MMERYKMFSQKITQLRNDIFKLTQKLKVSLKEWKKEKILTENKSNSSNIKMLILFILDK